MTDTITPQTVTNPITIIQCPDCSGVGYGIDCQRCNGSRWIYKPDPVQEEFQITPPYPTALINGLGPALWAYLERLEQKLDRLLAALEDTS